MYESRRVTVYHLIKKILWNLPLNGNITYILAVEFLQIITLIILDVSCPNGPVHVQVTDEDYPNALNCCV